MILTDREINAIEKRLNEATNGPYRIGTNGGLVSDHPVAGGASGSGDIEYYGGYLIAESITFKNNMFLSNAWQDIKNLIETIRTERSERLER